MVYPAKTNKRLNIQLVIMYVIAEATFPSLMNSKASKLKVEKVVNPPKNPTVIKSFTIGEISVLFNVIPKTQPIRKQPNEFAANVPYKDKPKHDLEIQDIKNLVTAPNPPPTNTAKRL